MSRFVYLAEDDRTAREQSIARVEALTSRLRTIGIQNRGGITTSRDLDPARFAVETAIIGSPETVAGRIWDLASELGTTTVNCNSGWFGTTSEAEIMRALHLLMARVLPALSAPVTAAAD